MHNNEETCERPEHGERTMREIYGLRGFVHDHETKRRKSVDGAEL